MPPREQFYFISVFDAQGLLTADIAVDIMNLDDPNYPENLFKEEDFEGTLSILSTQIVYDGEIVIGQAAEIKIRLFTDNLLQFSLVSPDQLSLYYVNGPWD